MPNGKSSSVLIGSAQNSVNRREIGTIPSVAVTKMLKVPLLVGVPLIVPVADIVRPGGRPLADHTAFALPSPVKL